MRYLVFWLCFFILTYPVSIIYKQMLERMKEPRHLKVSHKESYLISIITCYMSGTVGCQVGWGVPGKGLGWTRMLGTVRAWAVGPHSRGNFWIRCLLSVGTEVPPAFPRLLANWGGQSSGWHITTTIQVLGVVIMPGGQHHHDSGHPVFLLTARPKGERRTPAKRAEV